MLTNKEDRLNHQKPGRYVLMSSMIEEFKREHSKIIDSLKEVKELSIITHQGYAKLISVKESLFEHFITEEEKLYPVFHKMAEQNKKFKEILQLFAIDLENITRFVQKYFNSYNKVSLDTKSVEKFENLFMVLRNRIKNEENFLYSEYEEVNKL